MVRPHATIFKTYLKEKPIMSVLISIFLIWSTHTAYTATTTTDLSVSLVTVIMFTLLIGLLCGIEVYRKSDIAGEMINHIKETNRPLKDEQNDFLEVGIVAKNWFWAFVFMVPVMGALNMYLPQFRNVTYVLFDASYFMSFIYSSMAVRYMKAFSDSIGLDLIEENLERVKEDE